MAVVRKTARTAPARRERDERPARRPAREERGTSRRQSREREEERRPARKAPRRAKAAREPVTEGLHPVRGKLTQVQKLDWIVEALEGADLKPRDVIVQEDDEQNVVLSRRVVKAVLTAYHDLMLASVMPRAVGKFTEPGLFAIVRRQRPARVQEAIKKGTMTLNSFTGVEAPHKGRPRKTIPATWKPKMLPQAKFKAAVLGE